MIGAPWRRSFRNRLRILGSRFTLESVHRRFDSDPIGTMIIFNTSSVVECTTLALSPAVEVSHAVPLPFAASYAGGSDALHAVTSRY